jgi:membrane protein YdbS with pleckstrin-like domain
METIAEDIEAWQPLPVRARKLYMLHGLWWALPLAGLAFLGTHLADAGAFGVAGGTLAAAVLGALIGAWRGERSWRRTGWLIDAAGFNLRRGQWWRSETRVPQSRVQHLDVRRGPLQRRFGLSTLVIHTAGTRFHAVSIAGLDADDAERLRDALAHQDDDDDVD